MGSDEQLNALKSVFPDLEVGKEGGTEFVHIRDMPLPDGCVPNRVDGLLCPSARDGYPSRLFLSEQISHSGKGTNWNAAGVRILGRQWWAVSWKTRDAQTLLEMILDHLSAFQNESQS